MNETLAIGDFVQFHPPLFPERPHEHEGRITELPCVRYSNDIGLNYAILRDGGSTWYAPAHRLKLTTPTTREETP